MWVKSVSGWFDAYATTATLKEYTTDRLEYGKKYYATIEVESNKSAPSAGAMRVIIDNNKFDLHIKKGTDSYNTNTFVNKFTSSDIVFVLDYLVKGTIFTIKSIRFTKVNDDGTQETETTKVPTTTKAPTTTTKAPTTTTKYCRLSKSVYPWPLWRWCWSLRSISRTM